MIKSQDGEFGIQIESLKSTIEDKKQQINNLITTISKSSVNSVNDYINQHIDELDKEIKAAEQRLKDLQSITIQNELPANEFEILCDILKSFAKSFDTMNIEQKRAAIRTFVKKILWDGENVHIYLYGSDEKKPHCEDRK